VISGQYHRYGYAVYSDGEEIYTAGNCPGDSQHRVSLKSRHCPIEQIREWCEKTVSDFAGERGEKAGLVEFDEEFDEEYARLMGDHGGTCKACDTEAPQDEIFCQECGLPVAV